MAKYIIYFISIFLVGCKTNSNQVIMPEKFKYDFINFDVVSKNLSNEFSSITDDHKKMSEIIDFWFENRVNIDGFDGELDIYVKEMEFNRIIEDKYYKFSVLISLELIEKKTKTQKRNFIITSNEFGEMEGHFTIKDKENLDINIMHQSLTSVFSKVKGII